MFFSFALKKNKMSHNNELRSKSIAKGDVYLTPPEVVTALQKIIQRFVTDDTVLYDPTAADGRLLQPFEATHRVINTDIEPREKIGQVEVEQVDFLKRGTRPGNKERMMFVFNPPFGDAGVPRFVNQAATFLKPREYLVVIAGHASSNYNNLGKIDSTLHLREEHYIIGRTKFVKAIEGKEKDINAVIQVWQKEKTVSSTFKLHERLKLTKEETQGLPFTSHFKANTLTDGVADFYILRKSTGRDVGMVLTSEEVVGKLPRKGRRTVCGVCVSPPESKKPIKRCAQKRSKASCAAPCVWEPKLCSLVVKKQVTFSENDPASLIAISMKPKESREQAMWKFHGLYTMGFYRRYLGHQMTDMPQSIKGEGLLFMYKYPEKVPTRESLGIRKFWIGTPEQLKQMREEDKEREEDMKTFRFDGYKMFQNMKQEIVKEENEDSRVVLKRKREEFNEFLRPMKAITKRRKVVPRSTFFDFIKYE